MGDRSYCFVSSLQKVWYIQKLSPSVVAELFMNFTLAIPEYLHPVQDYSSERESADTFD